MILRIRNFFGSGGGMKIHYECFACAANQCHKIVELGSDNLEMRKRGVIKAAKLMASISENSIPAVFGSKVFLGVYEAIRNDDPFKGYKEFSNSIAKEVVRKLVRDLKKPDVKTSLKLAIIGNVIDFAVGYSPEKLENDVREMMKEELYVDDSEELFEKLSKGKTLLYLTDNCGEIYFDLLFLKKLRETFPHLKIYIAAKEGPIINDATVEDLRKAGFEEVGEIVSTGTRIVGVPFELVSEEFMEIFKRADVVIAKGQGNFETLSERPDERIFYLLKAKCRPIARELSVPQGALLCVRSSSIRT